VRSLLQQARIHDFDLDGGFDYVLIDSRTGFADVGGLCANLLADSVVLLSGLNDQNLLGTSSVLERLRQDRDESDLAVVLSPVPVGEEDLKLKRVERAREIFETQEAVQLPYHPRVALVEEPFCAKFPDAELTRAYRRLQDRVRGMASDDARAWSDRVREALGEQDHDAALRALEQLRLLDEDAARQYLRAVTMAEGLLDEWGEERRCLLAEAREKFDAVDGEAGIAGLALFNRARVDARLGDVAEMLADREDALEEDPRLVKFAEEMDDFNEYRDDERFAELVREARERLPEGEAELEVEDVAEPLDARADAEMSGEG
jgi:tetratricopeptide (TPR) repeat protein